jgi:hypothetical protein
MSTRRARTPAFGRTARLIVGALAVAAVVTTSALAGTIVGTAKNDTIRGTAGADKLYGRQGNDSLFGMAGGDYLNGGPGKDRFSCGAGRDTVVAERGEKVAGDCEVVRRTGGTTPAPPPTTPAPPPTPPPPAPPPPPPAPPPAKAGFFGGFASTGGSVNFVVAGDGRSLSQFKFTYEADCQPPGRLSAGITYSGTVPIAADGTFSLNGTTSSGTTVKFNGTFDAAGTTATGRFQIHVPFDQDGVHYECDSGGADWSAKWQG